MKHTNTLPKIDKLITSPEAEVVHCTHVLSLTSHCLLIQFIITVYPSTCLWKKNISRSVQFYDPSMEQLGPQPSGSQPDELRSKPKPPTYVRTQSALPPPPRPAVYSKGRVPSPVH
jgi:hypothetical protein